MKHLLRALWPALALCGTVQVGAAELAPLTAQAQKAFWLGDFNALARQNALLRRPGHVSADGVVELELWRMGLSGVINAATANQELYFQELEKQTLQWTQEHPQSALAHVLYAKVLSEHGWAYRGGGFVKDVPPAAWEDFERYQRRAVEHLLTHAEVALTDSHAHATLLIIGKTMGWDNKQVWEIINAGLKRNPDDVTLYFTALTGMLPKWGGDAKMLDRFISQATEQTKAQFGTGMYSRLYSAAAEEDFGHALFQNSYVDWPTLKQSYEDMLARYPSDGRRNRYAYMACMAKDKDTLLAQLALLGDKVNPASWGPNPQRSLEGCQRWAGQG